MSSCPSICHQHQVFLVYFLNAIYYSIHCYSLLSSFLYVRSFSSGTIFVAIFWICSNLTSFLELSESVTTLLLHILA
ncbi:hypothetical protein E2C01_078089 [Portunus trituberculatus]|uniref:Uncharacterized protein n=1 Tax=Portunus trituberculatus TaxID=210409 RepID=A0A5B7IG36_PORTR|nr:hypothetical protein [Portunus trituberculatus]